MEFFKAQSLDGARKPSCNNRAPEELKSKGVGKENWDNGGGERTL